MKYGTRLNRITLKKVASYSLSIKAQEDLVQIASFTIENWGVGQSRIYKSKLKEVFIRLSENPKMGESASEFHLDLRRFKMESHLIYYSPSKTGIFIVRILGQPMDIKNHL